MVARPEAMKLAFFFPLSLFVWSGHVVPGCSRHVRLWTVHPCNYELGIRRIHWQGRKEMGLPLSSQLYNLFSCTKYYYRSDGR